MDLLNLRYQKITAQRACCGFTVSIELKTANFFLLNPFQNKEKIKKLFKDNY